MSARPANAETVLAVHLATRGFGYTVFDVRQLIDWGTKETRDDKERRTLEHLEKLCNVYRPARLLLPDYTNYPSRQTPRILILTQSISTFANTQRVHVRQVSWAKVRFHFANTGAVTKHRMAEQIAARIPELAPHVPPFRKPWMSEHHRMSVFQAAALALAHLDGV